MTNCRRFYYVRRDTYKTFEKKKRDHLESKVKYLEENSKKKIFGNFTKV